MDRSDDLGVEAGHAPGDALLERLKTGQDGVLSLQMEAKTQGIEILSKHIIL